LRLKIGKVAGSRCKAERVVAAVSVKPRPSSPWLTHTAGEGPWDETYQTGEGIAFLVAERSLGRNDVF
jgi:hypothetical protein